MLQHTHIEFVDRYDHELKKPQKDRIALIVLLLHRRNDARLVCVCACARARPRKNCT